MSDQEISIQANRWIVAASIHGGKSGFDPDRIAKVIGMNLANSSQIVEKLIKEGMLGHGKRNLLYLTAKGHEAANAVKSF